MPFYDTVYEAAGYQVPVALQPTYSVPRKAADGQESSSDDYDHLVMAPGYEVAAAVYSAADQGASSPPAGSGAVAYSALSPTYGAASSQPPWPSAQYDHLAAEPRGAVYAVPGAPTAAGPRGQAVYAVPLKAADGQERSSEDYDHLVMVSDYEVADEHGRLRANSFC